MDTTSTFPLALRIHDLPLWRLLVALDDAERTVGPDSPTARALARAVRDRLRQEHAEATDCREVRRDA
jgi:hypothetical protein